MPISSELIWRFGPEMLLRRVALVGDNRERFTIDGRSLPLWHGTMRSHSDLSAHPTGPLASLIGMPPKSSWPSGLDSFHDVNLGGYFACWVDSQRKVGVVVYAVAANYAARVKEYSKSYLINDGLLRIMQSATLEAMH